MFVRQCITLVPGARGSAGSVAGQWAKRAQHTAALQWLLSS